MPADDRVLDALREIVGAAHVLTDHDMRASFETDWTGRFHGTALAVVRPADTDGVARVLRLCDALGVAVVPQGGNTGLVGGGVPRDREVVLSLRRLDEIDAVDRDAGEVVVGAGAVLEDVQRAVRAAGWDVGVDLAARGSCTVGGMVATNAGGEHVLRYGAMVEQLIGVEAVLADGSVVGRIPALRKDNTGFRWAGIMAGSEGVLGVVTRVHLRLVPLLPDRVVALCACESLRDALAVCGRMRRALPSLMALEACFADGIDLVCAHTGLPQPFPTPAPIVLLAECGGVAGSAPGLLDALGAIVSESPEVRETAVATDEAGRERLWRYREAHAEAINAIGIPHKLDVTLPLAKLPAFADAVRELVPTIDPAARAVLFGHLGDGNLHVNVLGLAPDADAVDHAVLHLVSELGGSISAEHGIGVAKRDSLGLSRSASDIEAMRRIKRALDPHRTLNPGVLFA